MRALAPICGKVTRHRTVYLLLYNPSKQVVKIRPGTLLANYELTGKEQVEEPINTDLTTCLNVKLSNAMMPHEDTSDLSGSQDEKIQEILDKGDWRHLTEQQNNICLS